MRKQREANDSKYESKSPLRMQASVRGRVQPELSSLSATISDIVKKIEFVGIALTDFTAVSRAMAHCSVT
ncbi:hypothetical protein E2C01_063832 [Portunus trituberculatus]|uniref:Uncharacterized protein n=1 Tax=Portunus trituberculatus TaxID=210409 RepID=A0A5B7HER2_PORTR|nr:hypothetical protein [Portunus trituberculatus]